MSKSSDSLATKAASSAADSVVDSVVDSGDSQSRVSFERLRERTDELELLISGLSLVALISLPGWMYDAYLHYSPRMSLTMVASITVLLPILSAICVVMSGLFVLHLAVRAHWVGLIGLKAAFPDGIRWDRLHWMGPLSRESFGRDSAAIESKISASDRLASIIFSLITMSAITLAILGGWMTLLFLIGGLFGNALGGTNQFINISVSSLFLAFALVPLSVWLLDGLIGSRWRWLRERLLFRLLLRGLALIEGLFFPRKLIATPRLYLQSNTLPRLFFFLFISATMLVTVAGNQFFQSSRGFDLFGTQAYISGRHLQSGQRSLRYENQLIARDLRTVGPLIPAPLIETSWLPLFLPHHALIDSPVLQQRCPEGPAELNSSVDRSDTNEAQAQQLDVEMDALAERASACLRRLWAVKLDDQLMSLEQFVVSERADLGLRGLSGYLPLAGLRAGPHRLEVIWRPNPEQDDVIEDYVPGRLRYLIPFTWAPEASAIPADADQAGQ